MYSNRKLNITRNKYYRQISLISLRTNMVERISETIVGMDDTLRNWLTNQLMKTHFNT